MKYITIFAGIICKLYDDLNDMKLLENNKYKSYINELLKGLQYMLITKIGSNNISFLFYSILINLPQFIYDNQSFLEFEKMGILLAFIYFLYLLLIERKKCNIDFYSLTVIFIGIIGTFICDTLLFKNIEYSNSKLKQRIIGLILSIFLINIDKISYDIKLLLYFIIGYLCISIIFQYYQLNKSKKKRSKKKKIKINK